MNRLVVSLTVALILNGVGLILVGARRDSDSGHKCLQAQKVAKKEAKKKAKKAPEKVPKKRKVPAKDSDARKGSQNAQKKTSKDQKKEIKKDQGHDQKKDTKKPKKKVRKISWKLRQKWLAYRACKAFFRDRLVAPATAKWARFSSVKWRLTDGGSWKLAGWALAMYVDSQNKFGAMIRTSLACGVLCVKNKCTVKTHWNN